jgi:nitroreductase
MSVNLEAIRKRISVRGYAERGVEESDREGLLAFTRSHAAGPFGNTVRFGLVEAAEGDFETLKSLGTYAMIRGARTYLAGAVKKAPGNMEDFGYCMEGAILEATSRGLGTCWLGGTLSRSTFGNKLGVAQDEVLPGVTPVGYAAEKRTIKERIIRTVIRASSRKAPKELFFEGDSRIPAAAEKLGKFSEVLEAVRVGPSASNKQPWRLIHVAEKNLWHLYIDEDPLYSGAFKDIHIQRVDAGIAMRHLETASLELGFPGKWTFQAPAVDAGKWIYIATWLLG